MQNYGAGREVDFIGLWEEDRMTAGELRAALAGRQDTDSVVLYADLSGEVSEDGAGAYVCGYFALESYCETETEGVLTAGRQLDR